MHGIFDISFLHTRLDLSFFHPASSVRSMTEDSRNAFKMCCDLVAQVCVQI